MEDDQPILDAMQASRYAIGDDTFNGQTDILPVVDRQLLATIRKTESATSVTSQSAK